MRRIITLLLAAIGTFSAITAFGQAPPPQGPPPGGPGMMLPLVYPGARVNREIEIVGDNLRRLLERDPSLQGVKRIRIVSYEIPRRPGDPPVPAQVTAYYDRILKDHGWKQLWRNAGMGRPRMVFADPEGNGIVSVVVLPTGVVATHIEGTADLQKMPVIDRLMRRALGGPEGSSEAVREAEEFVRNGQIDKAVETYKHQIEEDPQDSAPYLGLAVIQVRQGKIPEAALNFRRAIEQDPLNAVARGNYARLLASQKDWVGAEYEARQTVSLAPEMPMARMVLAEVYESRGMLKEAVDQYNQLLKNSGGRPEPYVKLGNLLEKLGRKEEAAQRYEDALKLNPNQQDAKAALDRLRK